MATLHTASKTNLFLAFLALAVAGSFLSPTTARAAVFRILDSSPDDPMITLQVTDFEEGFVLNDNVIQIGLGTEERTLADAAGLLTFQGSWPAEDFAPGERTLYVLQEPDGLVGAILHYQWFSEDGIGTIIGDFRSDSDAQPNLGQLPLDAYQADVFVEGHITIPFDLPALDAKLVTEPVPEPGTVSLMLAGFAVAVCARRRAGRS